MKVERWKQSVVLVRAKIKDPDNAAFIGCEIGEYVLTPTYAYRILNVDKPYTFYIGRPPRLRQGLIWEDAKWHVICKELGTVFRTTAAVTISEALSLFEKYLEHNPSVTTPERHITGLAIMATAKKWREHEFASERKNHPRPYSPDS